MPIVSIIRINNRYCARFIGKTLDHMWLACGTVFNEVLLWKVTDSKTNEKVPVRKRLTGYDGVIFSVRYYQERQLLFSVSDDRSIRVWRAVFRENFSDVTVSRMCGSGIFILLDSFSLA